MATAEILLKDRGPNREIIAQFPSAVNDYLQSDEFLDDNARPNTKAAYQSDLKDRSKFIQNKLQSGLMLSIDSVTHDYIQNLKERGRKTNTIVRHMVSVNKFFKWAAQPRNGLISERVLDIIPQVAPEKQKITPIDSLTIDRLRQSVNHDSRTAAMIELLLNGARNQQIADARIGDVEKTDDGIRIKLAKCKKDLELSGYSGQVIRFYIQDLPDNPDRPLFTSGSRRSADKPLTRQGVSFVLSPITNTIGINSPDHLRISARAHFQKARRQAAEGSNYF